MAVSIAGLRRNIKNVAHNYTDAQVKVIQGVQNILIESVIDFKLKFLVFLRRILIGVNVKCYLVLAYITIIPQH